MIRLLTLVKTYWIAFTLLILSAITILSLWPIDKLPAVPGTDKTHHLIAYTFLMLPVALRKPDKWILYGLIFIAYGGAIELLQPYVNRYGEWMDMIANTAGLVCAYFIARLVNIFFPVIPKQPK
ncbi:MAG: VanZ family protein [Desulfotalea sp.]